VCFLIYSWRRHLLVWECLWRPGSLEALWPLFVVVILVFVLLSLHRHPFLEHAAATAPAALRRLLLHVLRHAHMHGKELGGAAVQADALALVELALAVIGGHALGRAGLDEAGCVSRR
jgi:hypothetical protein